MNTSPEAEFDLEKLFLPAWAQEEPSANRYAKYTGNEGANRGFDGRSGERRGPRRDGPPGRGRDQARPAGSDRHPGPRREGGRQGPSAGPRDSRRDDRRGPERSGDRRQREERREPVEPLPEITVTLMPDDRGVESLSRQIKMSGRSFPLFGIAQMILQKPERQQVRFEVRKKPDGQPIQPLFLCAVDDTLWLSEEEGMEHALGKHFNLFYQAEKTPTDPPKGTYTFVAQCGMSGVILGPPNYHDYQNQLRKLHAERFSRMPFEVFKSRVKIVREETTVKKWIEEQSFKTEYVCLNVPEARKVATREELEQHFREVHLANIVKPVERHTLGGPASRQLRSPGLQRLVRHAWEEQKRFPLQIATILSQQFASHGLQFFKVNKTVTHVSVVRPHYLDTTATPVSDQVRRIVQFIDATPKCTRRKLVEALAPTPPQPPIALEHPTEGSAPAPKPAEPSHQPAEPEPTPEQASIIGDLHWLIHQGHVIEFANGVLETAKKPAPKPVRPPKPAATAGPPQQPASPEAAALTPVSEIPASDTSAVSETVAATEQPEPQVDQSLAPHAESESVGHEIAPPESVPGAAAADAAKSP